MKTPYILTVIAVLILGGVFLLSDKYEPESQAPSINVAPSTEVITDGFKHEGNLRSASPDTPILELSPSDPSIAIAPAVTETPQAQATEPGRMLDYQNPSDLNNLTGTNILFFKASWCVTCTQLYNALKAEEANIPSGVTIWLVDYDSNEAMRRSYGVTSQHTLVQIDTNKNKINLWRGGFSLRDVLNNIKPQ